jgi:hypothetical protein
MILRAKWAALWAPGRLRAYRMALCRLRSRLCSLTLGRLRPPKPCWVAVGSVAPAAVRGHTGTHSMIA